MAFASTQELLEELNNLFEWRPPMLINNNTSPSKASRKPAFFNKHFSENHILLRVVQLPNLTDDLLENVVNVLDSVIGILPLRSRGFPLADQLESERAFIDDVVYHERGVASFYDKYTARYARNVASTLALTPKARDWGGLLNWTIDNAATYGIQDAELGFLPKQAAAREVALQPYIEAMDGSVRPVFDKMRGKPISTWEMKSEPAGPFGVMHEVKKLGDFPWTYCEDTGCAEDEDIHSKHKVCVNAIVIGQDSQTPPWKIPQDLLHTPADSEVLEEENDDDDEYKPVASGSKRKALQPRFPPNKGKKHKRDNEQYQETPAENAQCLVQQAWAQATRIDGTLIVLHCGNFELVCIRHRATKTLYVSKVIEPHAFDQYMKLQIGIYIAAIQDLLDRKKQLGEDDEDDQNDMGNGGDRGRRGGEDRDLGDDEDKGLGGDEDRGPGSHPYYTRSFAQKLGRGSVAGSEHIDAIKETLHLSENRNLVLLYLRYGVYDSRIPSSFVCLDPPIPSHTQSLNHQAFLDMKGAGVSHHMTIIATSQIGQGVTGIVLRGTLKLKPSDVAVSLDVVVKLALDDDQRDTLRNEYQVYCALRRKKVRQGIAVVLGLFEDSEGDATALIMQYAGVPISKSPPLHSDCSLAVATLQQIHMAGILHGDICPENILLGSEGVTIIDFGHSKKCDNVHAKDKESASLCHILDSVAVESQCSVDSI